MADTIHSNPRFLRIKQAQDVIAALHALHGLQFNTWSGAGLTDRHDRPLVMVGWRARPKGYAENRMGLIFSGHLAEQLRDQLLEGLALQHRERFGCEGQVWTPKPKDITS